MPRSEKNAAGFMTSASGVTVYRGDAWPSEFRQQVFLAEPSGNLVHRQRIARSGVTFASERIDTETEFLTSTDNWFRPVNFVAAPDGTLYLLDMYRETIEHPWSMPDDLKAMLDLENGRDRGRIYRIAPPGFQRRPTPDPGAAATADLVALLAHPNVWHRETAHRLIFERNEPAAAPLLRQLRDSTTSSLARLHALWSLEGLDRLTPDDLHHALRDPEPGVREQAVMLAGRKWPELSQSEATELDQALQGLQQDPDPSVRFQLALVFGSRPSGDHAAALEQLAVQDADDPWMNLAVLSASPDLAPRLLRSLLDRRISKSGTGAGVSSLVRQLAFVTGARNQPEEVAGIAARLVSMPPEHPQDQLEILLALDDGLRRKGNRIETMLQETPAALMMLEEQVRAAELRLVDRNAAASDRVAALRVVSCLPLAKIRSTLLDLLQPAESQELQVAVVRTLAGVHDEQLAADLILRFRSATPAVQYEIIECLAAHGERLEALLDAIAGSTIPAAQVSPIRRTLLLNHGDEKIRLRAQELLGADRRTPRQDLLTTYMPALELPGSVARGARVFMRDCATCHRLNGQGHEVGPNLSSVRHRRPEEILIAVLDPNREVGPNFLQFAVVLHDGRTLTGMVAEETASSLTLRRADNQQDTILRQEITDISATGLSLMPEGLEKKVSPEEMSDLIAFLRAN